MSKCSLIMGMAFEGSEEPIVLLMTTSMPTATMLTFRVYIKPINQIFKEFQAAGRRHTVDQLYGFSGSPSFQDMIFRGRETLDVLEPGGETLLSFSSRSYLSVASASSIPETIRERKF